MMKVILINGSPRKNWNTHQLLLEAERGAREAGAETELIHLFDLNFKDCRSCFACKRKGNTTEGVCAIRDDLRPVYEKIADAEGLILGSPVYHGDMTGEAVSFVNRLLFPTMHYQKDGIDLVKKKKACGLIITMNCGEEILDRMGYSQTFGGIARHIGGLLGSCELLYSCDTLQFKDYSQYYAGMFDEQHKIQHHKEQFPLDLAKAYDLGKRIATKA